MQHFPSHSSAPTPQRNTPKQRTLSRACALLPSTLSQIHPDIISSIRASLNKPSAVSAVGTSAAFGSNTSNAQTDSADAAAAAATAAANDTDEGLNQRRMIRARAKARVDAICDVVAMAESLVRASLKKLALAPELAEQIK